MKTSIIISKVCFTLAIIMTVVLTITIAITGDFTYFTITYNVARCLVSISVFMYLLYLKQRANFLNNNKK